MGQLAVFGPGDVITVKAATVQEESQPEHGRAHPRGRPIREPVAWMGPFVMNTREEVVQAFTTTRPDGWAPSRRSMVHRTASSPPSHRGLRGPGHRPEAPAWAHVLRLTS